MKKRAKTGALIILTFNFLLLIPPKAVYGRSEKMPDATDKIQLKNGLTIITKNTTSLPIVSIRVFIKTGTALDPRGKSGLTNLVMTLITKGTKKRTSAQIAQETESLGSSIGASANEDYCEISMNITKKNLEKGFDIFSDVLLNPEFPESELQKEKAMVIAAIKSRKDHIFNVSFDILRKTIYGNHPYSNLYLGAPEDIEKITRSEIVGQYRDFVTAPNILLVAAGSIKPGEIKILVNKYLSGLRGEKAPEIKVSPAEPEGKTVRETRKFEQAYVMFGFLCPPVTSDDFARLKILDVYLGGGMSSLLFQELREKGGLGYEVHSFYQGRRHQSPFVIYIGLDQKSVPKAKEKIRALLEDIKNKPADAQKIEDAKNYLEGVYLLDHQSSGRQGWYLGRWETLGKGYDYDKKYISDLKKVTPQDIMNAAKKYLTDNNVLVEIGSEK